jgi:predicted phage tail component-like protein
VRSLSFNGIIKPYVQPLRGSNRPAWAPIEREWTEIRGMPGAHLSGTKRKVLVLNIPVLIKSESISELQKLKEDISQWLIHDEPKELIFDDEPDRVYHALIDGSFDPEEFASMGQGVLTFVCPGSHKKSQEKTVEAVNYVSVLSDGSRPTPPVIEVEVNQPTTFVAIGNGDNMNMVGKYQEAGQTPYIPLERKFWTEARDLIGWTDATKAEDATVSGTMKSNGYEFYSDDYGAGSQWHGPAMKTSLTESIQDFRIDVLVDFREIRPRDIGRIVITGLDEQGEMVAHMQIRRPFRYEKKNYGYFQAGNGMQKKTIALVEARDNWMWNNFSGLLRLERVGTEWRHYMSTINKDGVHTYPSGNSQKPFIDSEGRFTNKIRQIQIHLATYSDWDKCWQRIRDVKVYKINQEPDGVEYIAVQGDKIKFDHEGNIITKNGENIKSEKQFIGDYFKLNPGENNIIVEPADAIASTKVSWCDSWH